MGDKVKDFIEQLWLDSQKIRSKLTAEQIQQQIRTKRETNGDKLFQTHEYATINQIKYRFRKLADKHGITAKQQLIDEITNDNVE